jgi:hypothetical protein
MKDAKFEHRPKGAFIVEGREVGHTLQCCHCGGHFLSVRGSGTKRGFCLRCGQVTCGSKKCDACVPFEARLEILEGKRNQYSDLI